MSKKVFHFYRLSPEQLRQACQQPRPSDNYDDLPDEFGDLMNADIALGIAAQDLCNTRDELIVYARDAQLLPYLRQFVERRGWLDDDWLKRIAATDGYTPCPLTYA